MSRIRKLAKQIRKPRWVLPPSASIISVEECSNVQLSSLEPTIAAMVEGMYDSVGKKKNEACCEALFDIGMFRDRALKGDKEAANELHTIAVKAITALNLVAEQKPDVLRELASTQTKWPAVFSYSPFIQALLDNRLQTIAFATKPGAGLINHSDVIKNPPESYLKGAKGCAVTLINTVQTLRIARNIAIATTNDLLPLLQRLKVRNDNFRDELYQFHLKRIIGIVQSKGMGMFPRFTLSIVEKCALLPDFCAEKLVINQWWDAGYEILMLSTNGEPQIMPMLAAVGRSREKHYSGLKITAKGDEYKPLAVKANVKSKILTEFKEEFGRLANQLKKTGPLEAKQTKE